MTLRIGIDLGGTKTEVIALSLDGASRYRRRVPTPRDDYDATVRTIVDLVHEAEHRAGGRGTVGVGVPGAISPVTNRIKNANSTWLNGRHLHEDLSRALDRPVRLANDANCFALSEATDGAGAGHSVVFGVILGTGTGGGVVVDGRILVGPNAIAGEWGHNALPWPEADEQPGALCYCGHHGCIETFLSGSGLERTFHEIAPTKGTPTALHVAEAAAGGDPDAAAAVDKYCGRLAKALASIINVIDPDAIVLGGGLSNIDAVYARVPELWGRWVFSDAVSTPLLRAVHGDSSGVRGAAWLWER